MHTLRTKYLSKLAIEVKRVMKKVYVLTFSNEMLNEMHLVNVLIVKMKKICCKANVIFRDILRKS